jgi:hypothetical protein
VTRPWLTLPPLLADYARAARLLHLTTAELRSMHMPPPAEVRCWRTTPEGRQWQARLQDAIDGVDVTGTNQKGPETAPESEWRPA